MMSVHYDAIVVVAPVFRRAGAAKELTEKGLQVLLLS